MTMMTAIMRMEGAFITVLIVSCSGWMCFSYQQYSHYDQHKSTGTDNQEVMQTSNQEFIVTNNQGLVSRMTYSVESCRQ